MKNIYKKADIVSSYREVYTLIDVQAFSELDFSGRGAVCESDFFKALIVFKFSFSKEVKAHYQTSLGHPRLLPKRVFVHTVSRRR